VALFTAAERNLSEEPAAFISKVKDEDWFPPKIWYLSSEIDGVTSQNIVILFY
jgi:hypothetical protein